MNKATSDMKTAEEILTEHLGSLMEPIPTGTLYGIVNAMEEYRSQPIEQEQEQKNNNREESVTLIRNIRQLYQTDIEALNIYIKELEQGIERLKEESKDKTDHYTLAYNSAKRRGERIKELEAQLKEYKEGVEQIMVHLSDTEAAYSTEEAEEMIEKAMKVGKALESSPTEQHTYRNSTTGAPIPFYQAPEQPEGITSEYEKNEEVLYYATQEQLDKAKDGFAWGQPVEDHVGLDEPQEEQSIGKSIIENSKLINGYDQMFPIERAFGYKEGATMQSALGSQLMGGQFEKTIYWLLEHGYDVVKPKKSIWFLENKNSHWVEKHSLSFTIDPLKAKQFETEIQAILYARSCGLHDVIATEHAFI